MNSNNTLQLQPILHAIILQLVKFENDQNKRNIVFNNLSDLFMYTLQLFTLHTAC